MKKTTGQIVWGIVKGITLAAAGGFAVFINNNNYVVVIHLHFLEK